MAKKISSVFSNLFKANHEANPHYSKGWDESLFPKEEENADL